MDRALESPPPSKLRGYGAAPAGAVAARPRVAWSRHDLAFAASGAALAALTVLALWRPLGGVRSVSRAAAAAPAGALATARGSRRSRSRRSCSAGGRAVSTLSFSGVTYAYPGAGAPALRELTVRHRRRRARRRRRALGLGESTFVRAASGLAPHAHGGTFAGRVVAGGLDTREHGPGALAA